MENLPFTIFDLIVLAVILLSALMAFSSGFVRSVLFVLSWVGAVLIAKELFPAAREYGRKVIAEPMIADIGTAVVLFVVILIVLSVFSDAVSKAVSGSAFRGIDRILGLGFGILVGAVLVSAGYLVYCYIVPRDQQPLAVRNAQTYAPVNQGAEFLDQFVPADFKKKGDGTGTLSPADKRLGAPPAPIPIPPSPQPSSPQPAAPPPAPMPAPIPAPPAPAR
jgi:membrane protein required for colicin V production